MHKILKERLRQEALCVEETMRFLWRAYYAAKYDNTEDCLAILEALRSTTALPRWDKLIDDIRKELE